MHVRWRIMKVAACPECGEPGYLERRPRGHNTYLYVVHTYYVSNADGRRMRRRRRCYLGAEERYKHVDGKLGLGLSSPYTMTPPKLLLALERLLDMIDAKTTNMLMERRQAAQILLKIRKHIIRPTGTGVAPLHTRKFAVTQNTFHMSNLCLWPHHKFVGN
jgi:hypothetical protein